MAATVTDNTKHIFFIFVLLSTVRSKFYMTKKPFVAPTKSYLSSPPSYYAALPSQPLWKGQRHFPIDESVWFYTGVKVIYVEELEMSVEQILHSE
jgi:hypothetical protein